MLAYDGNCGIMSKPYILHETATIESFKRDPDFAAEYLNSVLEDGTQEEFVLALRRIADAFGMKDVADIAKLNSKTLYRTLSPAGNPELRSFQAILGAMGMRLAVTPMTQPANL
jgi:probable addiction module antidote protein